MNNETNSSYSNNRYQKSTEARERRLAKESGPMNKLKNIGLGAAALGVFVFAATHSDRVEEPPRLPEQSTIIDNVDGNTQVDVQYEESTQTISFNQQPAIDQSPATKDVTVEADDK